MAPCIHRSYKKIRLQIDVHQMEMLEDLEVVVAAFLSSSTMIVFDTFLDLFFFPVCDILKTVVKKCLFL